MVEAHLAACPSCQRRIADFRAVAKIIRESEPVLDPRTVNDVGRAVRRRIQAGEASKRPNGMMRSVAALVALGLLAITLWPAVSDADSLLGDFVQFRDIPLGPSDDVTETGDPETGTGVPTVFKAVELARLPLDLVRVGRSEAAPGRVGVNQLSRNDDGLSVLLEQFPSVPGAVVMDPDSGSYVVLVGGTNVLVMPDPRPDAVSALIWERDGTAFALLAMTSPGGGLDLADAMDIAATVLAAERDPPPGS